MKSVARSSRKVLDAGVAVFIGLLAHAEHADAQASYPNRPVRIISPHTPGMGTDSALRGMAQVLGKALGQPFIVENKPGGDGVIAGEACARAPADGYTLCMGDSLGTMLSPLIRASMSYEPQRAFTPVVLIGFLPSGIWMHQSLPVKSFGALLDYAKGHPNAVNVGTFGRASTPYLVSQLLASTEGARFNEVPYKSSGDAWRALIAGEVHMTTFTLGSGLKQAHPDVKLIAVNTPTRIAEAPEVPTYEEVGLKPALTTWFMLFAPAGTPSNIVERLNSELAKGFFGQPEMLDKFMTTYGYSVQGAAGGSVAAANDFMRAQSSMYAGLVKAAKIGKE
ncbi:tripartite tricarboxylate transporter substrate binding protein [soil metagenome]